MNDVLEMAYRIKHKHPDWSMSFCIFMAKSLVFV
jgi:hypothetical protein